MLFGSCFDDKVFYLWSHNPFALLKAGLLCLKLDFCYYLLEYVIERNQTDCTFNMIAQKNAEDMLSMIETLRYTQMLEAISHPKIRSKIIRLVGALVMLAPYETRHLELLKKVKKNYGTQSFPVFSDLNDEDLMIYETQNLEKYNLYIRTRDK